MRNPECPQGGYETRGQSTGSQDTRVNAGTVERLRGTGRDRRLGRRLWQFSYALKTRVELNYVGEWAISEKVKSGMVDPAVGHNDTRQVDVP